MKKIMSLLLTLALIVCTFSALTLTANADDALALDSPVIIEGNSTGEFSKWLSFTPEEDGRYRFEITYDYELYWGYVEGVLCDSSKTEIDYVINYTPTMAVYLEAELKADTEYKLQLYGEEIGEFSIEATKTLAVEKLEIDKYPDRMYYYRGTEVMDPDGLIVKAELEDGSVEYWSPNSFWIGIGPGGNCISMYSEQNPITGDWSKYFIECGGKKVEFSFELMETPIESVTINSHPSTIYYYGDLSYGFVETDGYYFFPSDFTGLNFTIKYKDGSSKVFTNEDLDTYSGLLDGEYFFYETDFDEIAVGDVPVHVYYMGIEFSFNIKMVESPVSSVKMIKGSDMSTVENDFEPILTGMSVELTYKDGTKKTVVADENNVIYDYYHAYIEDDSLETDLHFDYANGANSIYVSYAGTDLTYEGITVTDKLQIEDIELSNVSLQPEDMGIKLTYAQGYSENLNINKLRIIESSYEPENDYAYTWCKIFTDKGIIDCDIWGVFENGVLSGYEVAILGTELSISNESAETLGDVNNDGNINANDALLVLKHAAKIETLDDAAVSRADVTKDNTLNASDALEILKYAAQIIDSF